MAADFDAPVTNICFVCSEEDCPDGYKLVSINFIARPFRMSFDVT